MSNNQSSHTGNKEVKKEPFCRVCFNRGKSKKVYRSHYIWSEKGMEGEIVCPELKELKHMKCHYCHEMGHTTGYCKRLKMKDYGCCFCDTFNHKQKNCKLYRKDRDDKIEKRKQARLELEQEQLEASQRAYDLETRSERDYAAYQRYMWVYRDNPSLQNIIRNQYENMLYRDR